MAEIKRLIKGYSKAVQEKPTFPYCLESYEFGWIHPLGELWYKRRPYLQCGSSFGPDGDFSDFYDLTEHQEFTVDLNNPEGNPIGPEMFKNKKWYGWRREFPEKYLATLTEYKFTGKQLARHHGQNYTDRMLLILKFNDEWALFRFGSQVYRIVFLPYTTEVLKLF